MWKNVEKNARKVEKTQGKWEKHKEYGKNVEKTQKNMGKMWKKHKESGKTQGIWEKCGKNTRIWKNVEKTQNTQKIWEKHKEYGKNVEKTQKTQKIWEKHKEYGKNVEKTQGKWEKHKEYGKNVEKTQEIWKKCGKNTKTQKIWEKHKEYGKNVEKTQKKTNFFWKFWSFCKNEKKPMCYWLEIGLEFRKKCWFLKHLSWLWKWKLNTTNYRLFRDEMLMWWEIFDRNCKVLEADGQMYELKFLFRMGWSTPRFLPPISCFRAECCWWCRTVAGRCNSRSRPRRRSPPHNASPWTRGMQCLFVIDSCTQICRSPRARLQRRKHRAPSGADRRVTRQFQHFEFVIPPSETGRVRRAHHRVSLVTDHCSSVSGHRQLRR